ncbi:hypothetical protein [Persicirhabdus sediminis]|uniref:Uncharacterized protein n=1 Tax=Persicirhabdus sediminis TaxID=454144 RepID=A0A8J7MCP7_9BACT|nr:hypothetical protein [Persicirhabdus sediminis]MBK1790072.1 hypothetical protein [Persicirhabdus sediminis]
MTLKTMLAGAGFSIVTATATLASTDGWLTDLEAAKKVATAENKDIFINFTGSDW